VISSKYDSPHNDRPYTEDCDADPIIEGPSVTVAAGEAVGTLGPFQGELQGSIYDRPDGAALGGCTGGAAGPFGYTPCFNLPVPERTAASEDQRAEK